MEVVDIIVFQESLNDSFFWADGEILRGVVGIGADVGGID